MNGIFISLNSTFQKLDLICIAVSCRNALYSTLRWITVCNHFGHMTTLCHTFNRNPWSTSGRITMGIHISISHPLFVQPLPPHTHLRSWVTLLARLPLSGGYLSKASAIMIVCWNADILWLRFIAGGYQIPHKISTILTTFIGLWLELFI